MDSHNIHHVVCNDVHCGKQEMDCFLHITPSGMVTGGCLVEGNGKKGYAKLPCVAR